MPVGAPLLVDVWACRPHYLDHLAPVWAALPAHLRGRVVVDASGTLVSHAESLGMGLVLAAVIEEAAADHPARRAKRERAVAAAYGVLEGGAAGRAAAVVAAVADGTIPAMPERHPKADAYFRLPARMWLDALGRPTTRRADGVRLLGRGGSPLPWDVAYDLGLADPPPEPGDAFHTMTVARLRELARLSGLPTSGSKAQLVARLRQDHTDDPTTRQVPPRTKATA